jgi:hypothetical protein
VVRVEPYEPGRRRAWNEFVARSKNATFLFHRDYLEYHADRFVDASRLIWLGERLVALFPASLHGDEVRSHGGLTYGGVLSDERMSTALMLEVMSAVVDDLRRTDTATLLYKPIPHIYHRLPAEEDLYALFRFGARLVRRDASASCRSHQRAPLTKGRKWALKQGLQAGLELREGGDWQAFMAMEAALLQQKHGVQPVHRSEELERLAASFPHNIRLFTAYRSGELLAGTVIYETPTVAHAQYISATERGRDLRALDVLIHHLLSDVYLDKEWFDFGISTVDEGQTLNLGLAANKESWGARTTIYDAYALNLRR